MSTVRSAPAPSNGDEAPSYMDLRDLIVETTNSLRSVENVPDDIAQGFHANMVVVLNKIVRVSLPANAPEGPNLHEPLPVQALTLFGQYFRAAYQHCLVDEPIVVHLVN